MGVLLGFAPWAVYWVLAGNTPLLIAATAALAVAVAVLVVGREPAARFLAIGAVATFAVLAVAQAWAPDWVLTLSFAGLLATLPAGMAQGRSAVQALVTAELPDAVAKTDLLAPITTRVTWIWLAAGAAMTVSAAVGALVGPTSGYLCSWVLPFALLAAAAIASHTLTDRMSAGFGDAVRKTSFVAFVDLEIDQLYYLATEHANREVGAGEQAYNVTVGTNATPLLGDDTRVSWPSTYKVRRLTR